MNMFTDTITIINTTNIRGVKSYIRTVVSGALFFNSAKAISKEYGLQNTDVKMCFIPYKSVRGIYIDSVDYQRLQPEARPDYVTLQKGDYIVRGIATDVDTKDLYLYFRDVLRINTIDYLDKGGLPHFEVGGS